MLSIKKYTLLVPAIQQLMEEHTFEFQMDQSDCSLDHLDQCTALKPWCLSEGKLSRNFKEVKYSIDLI